MKEKILKNIAKIICQRLQKYTPGKTLILAEKPSLGMKIAEALGVTEKNDNGNFENENIIIASLVGHVVEPEYSKIFSSPEDSDLDFEKIKLVPKKDKSPIVKKIKAEITRNDVREIVNCGDSDAEGSYLVYELLEYFNLVKNHKKHKPIDKSKRYTRMWIIGDDKSAITTAFENRYSQKDDMGLVNAAKIKAKKSLMNALDKIALKRKAETASSPI